MKVLACAAAAMAAFLSCAPARAETTLCTEITALPFTITVQGVYCLKQNLNVTLATGNAITINAGNVIIDFNEWRINNQVPLATNQGDGVYALDRKNITLKNGFIRGFHRGIFIDEVAPDASASHLIENMKIADSGNVGIQVEGDKSAVRDNRVLASGGGPSNFGYGIALRYADDGLISGNVVAGVSDVNSTGIQVTFADRVEVSANTIRDVSGGTTNRGITLSTSDHAIVAGNRLLNNPGAGTSGIDDFGSSVNILCYDNVVGGFSATPLAGCDASDGNRVGFN